MEFQFYGANCIKITNRKTSIIVDDNLAQLGAKQVTTAKDIALLTSAQMPHPDASHFVIDQPGEYEVSDVSVQGIAARAHLDEEKTSRATMYRLIIDGVRIAIVGHIHPDLSDSELEALGTIDILFVPIGGNGFTLDGIGAGKVVKEIEPKLVIPTHFDDSGLKFEVPQAPLEEGLKGLGMEVSETLDSLKLKSFEFGEGSRLVVLNRS